MKGRHNHGVRAAQWLATRRRYLRRAGKVRDLNHWQSHSGPHHGRHLNRYWPLQLKMAGSLQVKRKHLLKFPHLFPAVASLPGFVNTMFHVGPHAAPHMRVTPSVRTFGLGGHTHLVFAEHGRMRVRVKARGRRVHNATKYERQLAGAWMFHCSSAGGSRTSWPAWDPRGRLPVAP
jgi:hypothetical protein